MPSGCGGHGTLDGGRGGMKCLWTSASELDGGRMDFAIIHYCRQLGAIPTLTFYSCGLRERCGW